MIAGGESGRKPRPMNVDWVLDIQEKCEANNVKFFFKQWGGTNKKKTGRQLNGRTYDDMPDIHIEDLEFPGLDILDTTYRELPGR